MRTLLSIACVALSVTALAQPEDDRFSTGEAFMRGMVVSCPRAGQIWGSPRMAEALGALDALGVEWIAIHPYAGVRRDGSMRQRPTADADYLVRAAEMMRSTGMRIFWKPHLAYWGSFDWRGDIEFSTEEEWQRFFTGYSEFILDQAAFAQRVGAELFAVGVELELTAYRPEWTALIDEVRRVYSGRLTYAANWDRVETVPFWDRMDLVGVHAYFPLSSSAEPTGAELAASWEAIFSRLGELSRRVGDLPIFFAEIGYNRSLTAATEPWSYAMTDSPTVRRLRRQLIEVAIEQAEAEPLVTGMFWWKWIPGAVGHDRDFSMKDPEALEALAARWNRSAATTAE